MCPTPFRRSKVRSLRGRRIAFGVLGAAALIALISSGDAIYLWILFFQACVLLAGWVQVRMTFRAVNVRIDLPEGRTESGERVEIPIRVAIQMPIAPAHLAVELLTADARSDRSVVYASVVPGKGAGCVLACECPYRGEYEIGAVALEGVDLFGLIRMRVEGERLKSGRSSIVVLPRTYDIGRTRLDLRMSEGAEEGAKRDAGEVSSIAELRGWREGDALNRVHWKLSARARKLIVKEYAGSFDAKSLVFVDGSRAGYAPAEDGDESRGETVRRLDFEETVSTAAASCCRLLCESGHQVRLVTCGESRFEAEGGGVLGLAGSGFETFCRGIANMRFGGRLPAPKVLGLDIERRGAPDSLIYVSGDASAEMVEVLSALSERGSRVTLVCCGDELSDAAYAELGSHGVIVERARRVEGGVLV